MLKVLQQKGEIQSARKIMKKNNQSIVEGVVSRFLRKLGLARGLPVGDHIKSWDVQLTLEFISKEIAKDSMILDLGAYCSEVPVSLKKMGYINIHGIDLNPGVVAMPYADLVKYDIGNFMETPYVDASFDVITAISVIEHGYEPSKLFSELSRLLRPGGYFISSFDYWPEKIDTSNTLFFDLSWLIFSEDDVRSLLNVAYAFGLSPIGHSHTKASERAVSCAGFNYTFGWLVLRKI